MRDLGTLGGPWSYAFAVNDIGWVTGQSVTADGYERAFLHTGSSMVDLGDFGGRSSIGLAIDVKGQVVGRAAVTTLTPDENPWRAFVYSDGRMRDINGLVDSGLDGAVLYVANGINERGQIVANGCKGLTCRAYRLDPLADPLPPPIPGVPTLSGFALLAMAALVVAGAHVRRPR